MSNTTPATPSSNEEEVYANEIIQPGNHNKTNKNHVMNIIEVSNIYPTNLVKHPIHASQRQLIAKVRAEAYNVCREKIPYKYIRWAFNALKNGFVYTLDNKVSAFCIWRIEKPKMDIKTLKINTEMYIFLICGLKLDYRLIPRILDDSVHYCRRNNIQGITLKAANSDLKRYYIANGFKENTEIGGDEILQFDVSKSRISHPETRTAPAQTKRRTRRHREFTE